MSASDGRSSSGDRFYIPPAVRRKLQLQQQLQQQQQKQMAGKKQQEKQKKQQRHDHHQNPVVSSPTGGYRTSSMATATAAVEGLAGLENPTEINGSEVSVLTNVDRFVDQTGGQRTSSAAPAVRSLSESWNWTKSNGSASPSGTPPTPSVFSDSSSGVSVLTNSDRFSDHTSGQTASSTLAAKTLAENRTESNGSASSTETSPQPSVSPRSGSRVSVLTNLDRFLERTTPFLPVQYLSKTCIQGWESCVDECQPYFVLGDLWDSFKEPSAYGVGVPLLLNGRDSVAQYYVPYLSGIQLFIDLTKPFPRIRKPDEERDDDSSRDTGSNGCSALDMDRGPNYFQGKRSQHNITDAAVFGIQELSMTSKPFNRSSSEDGESCSSPGALMFEYMEYDRPYDREPLADKISSLASQFPNLKTYRSCDLSPGSWVSVAWYPVYRIPTGPTLRNLDSCFLTYHSLSTHVHGAQNKRQGIYSSCPRETRNSLDMPARMPLPIFGLATYKFEASLWDQMEVESQKANLLSQCAEEWLRLLNVNHPDYIFFISRR